MVLITFLAYSITGNIFFRGRRVSKADTKAEDVVFTVNAIAYQLFSFPSIHPAVEVYERHTYSGAFALFCSLYLFCFLRF